MTLSQDDLLKVFVEEALEHLASIENGFLALEKTGGAFDPDIVNRVFRAAHSIKGGAGFIGLRQICELSHGMETVLCRFRKEKTVPPPEIVHILLTAVDTLKYLVTHVENSDETDISLSLNSLNDLVVEGSSSSSDHKQMTSLSPLPQSFIQSIREIFTEMAIPEKEIEQVRSDGKIVYILKMDSPLDPAVANICEQMVDYIHENLTVLASLPQNVRDVSVDTHDAASRPALYVAFATVLKTEDVLLLLDIEKENLFPETDFLLQQRSSAEMMEPFDTAAPAFARTGTPQETDGADPALEENGGDAVPFPANRNLTTGIRGAAPLRSDAESSPESLPSSIRVSVELLDSLMNLAGELVLGRNQLLKSVAVKDLKNTEIVSKRVDAITSDLQKVILQTRMQPVGRLFNRFPRVVRDLSRELGKLSALEVEGVDVELDRTLIEAMSDPLNHLIRNAVDHGIEMPDVRKRCGKPETGTIRLKAYNQAGQVVVEVSDDGGGIDPEKVAAAAVSRGFITEEKTRILAPKDKMNLIFLPGFSTAGKITDLSGRGVGMDVVKTNLDQLGGLIDLISVAGMGTRFTVKLPLTLAIIPSQIVLTEGERFAIPQMNLAELIRIPAARVQDRIERIGDAEVVRLREKLLPLVRLSDILRMPRTFINPVTRQRMMDRRGALSDRRSKKSGLVGDGTGPQDLMSGTKAVPSVQPERSAHSSSWNANRRNTSDRRHRPASAIHIAVVSTGQLAYGLVVDGFHDAEEIVVKPLGRNLKSCRAYAGATIMGDGKVVLILDVNNLSEIAGLFSVDGTRRAAEVAGTAEKTPASPSASRNLLIFRNAETEQFALPLDQVIRIEKIRSRDIQYFGDFRAIAYNGGNLPVFTIDEVAQVRPLAEHNRLIIIVLRIAGRDVGLLGIGPVDSVTTSAGIDDVTLRQPGIRGSVVLAGKITLVVDMEDVIIRLHPEWVAGDEVSVFPFSEKRDLSYALSDH